MTAISRYNLTKQICWHREIDHDYDYESIDRHSYSKTHHAKYTCEIPCFKGNNVLLNNTCYIILCKTIFSIDYNHYLQISMDVEEDEKPQLLLDDFCLYDKHGHLGELKDSFH